MTPQPFNPFSELTSDQFELLCRDLLERSCDGENAGKLFESGSKQYGVDVVAFEIGATRLIVAQCKRYIRRAFKPADIDKAVSAFLDHWDAIWKDMRVSRFKLYVSQNVNSVKHYHSIQNAKDRLGAVGIEFDLIDAQQLIKELRPHRDLVRFHLKFEHLVAAICGVESRAPDGFARSPVEWDVLTRNLEISRSLLSSEIRETLERIREHARSGDISGSIKALTDLKSTHFHHIDSQARAEVLSLHLRIAFPSRMTSQEARLMLSQIEAEDPSFDKSYLSALIVAEEAGYKEGLQEIGLPTDVAALNLKLAFLLNLGKAEDVCRTVAETRISPNAETKRLHAMGLLSIGKLADAELLANEAYLEQPTWEGVRWTLAIIVYHVSVSPQVLSENPLVFPSPQPWELVKSDDQSLEKRRHAAALFEGLLKLEPKDETSTELLQAWHLACLADDSERFETASNAAADLLKQNPTNAYVLIWALARSLLVDFSPSQAAFENRFEQQSDLSLLNVNDLVLPLAVYLNDKKVNKARRHLLNVKPVLRKRNEHELVAYWECQVALAMGEYELVEKKYARRITDLGVRQRIQVSALIESYNRSPSRKSWRFLSRRLLKLYRRSRETHYLSLYCQICYGARKWGEIFPYADALIQKTQSVESLHLVCSSFHASRLYGKCLEYLERWQGILPRSELTVELQRLKAHALLQHGNIANAAAEAISLWEADHSLGSLQLLVETHRYLGNTRYVQQAIEQHDLSNIDVRQRLKLASVIAPDNQLLAATLLRQALPEVQSIESLLDAVFIQGKQLGLDSEVAELLPLIVRKAEQGNQHVRLLTLAETEAMISERSDQVRELYSAYRKGEIPLHVYCKETNLALSYVLHSCPQTNKSTLNAMQRNAVLIRSGARTIGRDQALETTPAGDIYFDVSTLLVAQHLELLPRFERLCGPIYLPKETIPFLDAEILQAQTVLPARKKAVQLVLDLLSDGRITALEPASSLPTSARQEYGPLLSSGMTERDLTLILESIDRQASLVTYLPLYNQNTKERTIELPADLSRSVVNWASIVESLLAEGCLTGKVERVALDSIKAERSLTHASIAFGTRILLAGPVVSQFAEMGVLETVCGRYSVLLDAIDFDMLKAEFEAAKQQESLVDWLRGLKAHLARGFEDGRYQLISPDMVVSQADLASDLEIHPRTLPLFQLLSLKDDSTGAVFVDDRWANSYSSIDNKIPILSIYEGIRILAREGLLTNQQCLRKMIQLRRENFCYIPLQADELESLLGIGNSAELMDPAEQKESMAVLRRYYAEHLLDERWLRRPLSEQVNVNYFAELEFVSSYQRSVLEVLISIWRESQTDDLAIQASDQLFNDFYLGRFGANHFYPPPPDIDDSERLRASDYVEMCIQGVSLLTNPTFSREKALNRLKSYLRWVEGIFGHNLLSSAHFVDFVVTSLETYVRLGYEVARTTGDLGEKPEANAVLAIQIQFFDCLPDIVRERLYSSTAFKDLFGVQSETFVSLGDHHFSSIELSRVIASVLTESKTAVIASVNHQLRFTVEKGSGSTETDTAIVFTDENGAKFNVTGSISALQLPTGSQRLNYIKSIRTSFDCDDEEFLSAANRIAFLEDAAERIDQFSQWIDESMAAAYDKLVVEIENRRNFNFGAIERQPLEGLPAYFRFPTASGDSFDPAFKTGCEIVLKELGLEEALNRYSLFPCLLPETLLSRFRAMPPVDRSKLLNQFRIAWRSPVSRFHYLHLCLAGEDLSTDEFDSVRTAVARMAEPVAAAEFEIHKTLLILAESMFVRKGIAGNWDAPMRLALTWAHASKLGNVLLLLPELDGDVQRLSAFLDSFLPAWFSGVFDFNDAYEYDVLSPHACRKEMFFGFGLGVLFENSAPHRPDLLGITDVAKEICFRENKEAFVPDPMLFQDLTRKFNSTGSWMGVNGFDALNRLMVPVERVTLFTSDSLANYVSEAMSELELVHYAETWKGLLVAASGVALNEADKRRLEKIIDRLDFPAIWNEHQDLGFNCLGFLASSWRGLTDSSRQKLKDLLSWAASELETKYSLGSPRVYLDIDRQRTAASQIAQIALMMTKDNESASDVGREWNKAILELGVMWPGLHTILEPLFLRMMNEQPSSHVRELSKNILRARQLR